MRPEVEKLLQRFPDDFIAEELFSDLVHTPPKATLFLLLEDKPVGAFVVELVTERRSLRRFLNVWVLCAKAQMKYREEVKAYLDNLAKTANCTEIEFRTARKGWVRALRNDFSVKTYVLTRKIQ